MEKINTDKNPYGVTIEILKDSTYVKAYNVFYSDYWYKDQIGILYEVDKGSYIWYLNKIYWYLEITSDLDIITVINIHIQLVIDTLESKLKQK